MRACADGLNSGYLSKSDGDTCDEYPFASTYQGAYYAGSDGYSAR